MLESIPDLTRRFSIQCANVADLTGLCGLVIARKILLGLAGSTGLKVDACERLVHLDALTRTQLVLREARMKRGFEIFSNTNRLGEFWKIKFNSLRMEPPKSEVITCQLRAPIC